MPIPTTPPYPPLSFSLPKVSFRKIPAEEALELSVPAGVHERQHIDYGFNNGSEFVRPEHYLRHIEPAEAELKNRVEYDMDEQDQEWLDFINADRKRSQMDIVSYEVFEILMDRIEKEWFDLMKRVPKKAAPSTADGAGADSVEDTRCAICDDGECENSNAIVFCDGCNLAAHQDCYGIPYIPEGQWLCRKCTVSPDRAVSCLLCPHEGGAFKQTSNGKWAHLLCAIWIPETGVSNPVYMEPIDSIEQIPKARWKLQCYLCRQKMGACIQCDNRNCYTAFHVTCAREAGLLLKFNRQRAGSHGVGSSTALHADSAHAANISLSDDEDTGPEVLRACCHKHLPKEVREERDRLGLRFPIALNLRGEDDDTLVGSRASTPIGMALDGGADGQKKKKNKSGANAVNGSHAVLANGDATPTGRTSKSARAYKKSYRAGPPLVPKYILDRVMEYTHKIRIRAKPQFVAQLARFWSLKREARRGAPLLKRLHLEPWTAAPVPKEQAESEKAKKLQFLTLLREDLERVRMLAELSRKREREKYKQIEVLRSVLVDNFVLPHAGIMRKAFNEIVNLDRQGLFSTPVSAVEVPDYYDIIKTPMDWGQINNRLEQNAYASVAALKKDVMQVFINARLYNKPDTPYHKLAIRMENMAMPIFDALERYFASIHHQENSKMQLAIQGWKDEQESNRREGKKKALSDEDLHEILERLESDLTLHFEPDMMILDLIEDPDLCVFESAIPDEKNGTGAGQDVPDPEATGVVKLNFIENLLRQDNNVDVDELLDGYAAMMTPDLASVETMAPSNTRKKKGKRTRPRTTAERAQKRQKTTSVDLSAILPELVMAAATEPAAFSTPAVPKIPLSQKVQAISAPAALVTSAAPAADDIPKQEPVPTPLPEPEHESEPKVEAAPVVAQAPEEIVLTPSITPASILEETPTESADAGPVPAPEPGAVVEMDVAADADPEPVPAETAAETAAEAAADEPKAAVTSMSTSISDSPVLPTDAVALATAEAAAEIDAVAAPKEEEAEEVAPPPPLSSTSASALSSVLSTPVLAQEAERVPPAPASNAGSDADRTLTHRRAVAPVDPATLAVQDVSHWDTFKRFNTGWVLPEGTKRHSRPQNLNESKLTVDRGPKEVAARVISKGKETVAAVAGPSSAPANATSPAGSATGRVEGSSDLSSVSSSDISDLSDPDDDDAEKGQADDAGPSRPIRARRQRPSRGNGTGNTSGSEAYKRDRNGRFSRARARVVMQRQDDESDDEEEEEDEEEDDDEEGDEEGSAEEEEEEDEEEEEEEEEAEDEHEDEGGTSSGPYSSYHLHRSTSLQSSKSREDRGSSSRRRGRVKMPRAKNRGEGEAEEFEDGTMVWAKITGYPFSPAVIVDPHVAHASVPADVMRSEREEDEIHLVRFYGQKSQWRWVPTRKLRFMFEDEELDKQLLKATDGRTPHSKAAVREAFKLALAEKE